MIPISLHPPFYHCPMLSMAHIYCIFKSVHLQIPNLWTSDQVAMALVFNNDHIVYYHMDSLQSMDLAWPYFTHPDYWLSNVGSTPIIYLLILLTKWGLIPIATLTSLMDGQAIHLLALHVITLWLSLINQMLICLLELPCIQHYELPC